MDDDILARMPQEIVEVVQQARAQVQRHVAAVARLRVTAGELLRQKMSTPTWEREARMKAREQTRRRLRARQRARAQQLARQRARQQARSQGKGRTLASQRLRAPQQVAVRVGGRIQESALLRDRRQAPLRARSQTQELARRKAGIQKLSKMRASRAPAPARLRSRTQASARMRSAMRAQAQRRSRMQLDSESSVTSGEEDQDMYRDVLRQANAIQELLDRLEAQMRGMRWGIVTHSNCRRLETRVALYSVDSYSDELKLMKATLGAIVMTDKRDMCAESAEWWELTTRASVLQQVEDAALELKRTLKWLGNMIVWPKARKRTQG